ncbi:MAG: chemotaxis protein CheW, partial [bacterium]
MNNSEIEQWIDQVSDCNNELNDLFLALEEAEFEDEDHASEALQTLDELIELFEQAELHSFVDLTSHTSVLVENLAEGTEEFAPTVMDILYEVIDEVESAIGVIEQSSTLEEPSSVDMLVDKLSLFAVDVNEQEETEESSESGQESDEEESKWADYEYNELQQEAKQRDIKANQSREDLIRELEQYEESKEETEESTAEGEIEETVDESEEEEEEEEAGDPVDQEEPAMDEEDAGDYLYDPWDPAEFGQMVDDYLAESREQLTQLTNSLIELEQEKSPELIDSIFRVAHTLKGSSGMIGLEVLEDLAHSMEELLDEVRDGERDVTEELIDLLLLCNDKIEHILDTVEALEPVHVRVEHLLDGLDGLRRGEEIDVEEIRSIEDEISQEQQDVEEEETEEEDTDTEESVTESIRVNIDKMDDVINLVGELVIDKGRLDQKIQQLNDLEGEINQLQESFQEGEISERDFDRLGNEMNLVRRAFQELSNEVEQSTDDMDRVISELQESVMRTRMVPIAEIFNKFPRLVRDLCRQTGKEVDLRISGEDTEMDKTVIEKIGDPLMHIIRNAVDHGIESPEERKKAGKYEEGTLEISAGYEGDLVVIEIEDDGGGIPTEVVKQKALDKAIISEEEAEEMPPDKIHQLIFEPGFSTTEEVTETSGRGVGMDVVRSNIMDLNGSVDLESTEGEGTKFTIKLPLTLAIIQVLIVRIGEREFALPLSSVQENLRIRPEEIQTIGQQEVFELRGKTLSLARLRNVLGYRKTKSWEQDIHPVVVAQSGNERLGILVDELVQKQEIVIKDLGSILNNVQYASGATIMGDGSVVLIVDLGEIVHNAEELSKKGVTQSTSSQETEEPSDQQEATSSTSVMDVLLVEDTETQRTMMKQQLENSGFKVDEAEDGREGLNMARDTTYDFVMTDIEMPHMDGYE